MKNVFAFLLVLLALQPALSQSPYPEFSPLSGRAISYFSSAKSGDSYIYLLSNPPDGIMMYRLDGNGQVLDSIPVPNSIGYLASVQDRLFFEGVDWDGSVFTTMRQVFTEYDAQFQVVDQVHGAPLQPIHAPIISEQTATIVNIQSGGFTVYNDTLFSFQKYLVVDSPQVFLGIVNLFTKTGTDGTVYASYPLAINALYNCFFVKNRLFVQGSGDIGPFDPRALLEFDSYGNLVRGIDYDSYGSGEYIDGALGGWHNGRFYFTYRGYNPTLPGCSAQNATIDVRDSCWTVLHRLKLPDCGYLVSGKMPFGFDAQNNVYYAAPHESYRKIMVYKYTPDFQLIWKTELNFENEEESCLPFSQHTTDDGGILLNCNKLLNGARSLVIFKIYASGEVVSSIQLPGGEAAAPVVFPNPTRGLLYLSPDFPTAAVALASSLDGRFIGTFDLQSGQIDLSACPPGAYQLSFWDASGQGFLGNQVVVKQ